MGSLEKIWGMFSFNLPPICGMISSFFHRNNVCAKCALIFSRVLIYVFFLLEIAFRCPLMQSKRLMDLQGTPSMLVRSSLFHDVISSSFHLFQHVIFLMI